jgi:hypothetical protein
MVVCDKGYNCWLKILLEKSAAEEFYFPELRAPLKTELEVSSTSHGAYIEKMAKRINP